MHIVLIGMSYKTAPVEIREAFALSETQKVKALRQILEEDLAQEVVILSTCNRTELYALQENPDGRGLIQFLCKFRKQPFGEIAEYFYTHEDAVAIEHLFKVSSGLDSMIVGEAQVLAQVKEAHQTALEAESSHGVLNTLFQAAVSAGKRARTETEIARGAVSVSHAAVEKAEKLFGDLSARKALVLGAGEMSESTAKLLISAGVKSIIVSTRTFSHAQELAEEIGGEAIRFDQFASALQDADIVISSTGAPHIILEAPMIQEVMKSRQEHPLFLIDIAVPRDIDPTASQIPDVHLYDIDDLHQVVGENLADRAKEALKVKQILQEETNKYIRWFNCLDAVPTIADLQRKLERNRKQELREFEHDLSKFSESNQETVDRLTKGLVRRILKKPMKQLKKAVKNGDSLDSIQAIRYLFGLDETGSHQDDEE